MITKAGYEILITSIRVGMDYDIERMEKMKTLSPEMYEWHEGRLSRAEELLRIIEDNQEGGES